MRYNKVEYSTAAGVYFTTHDVKVPFCMPDFSSSKIINHHFHVDNDKWDSVIGYDMIIVRDLMVQLGPKDNFKHQVLQWDGSTIHMKEPNGLLGKSNITKRDMREVVMQTAEPYFTQKATEQMVKILNSTYAKEYLKKVANNTTHMNS